MVRTKAGLLKKIFLGIGVAGIIAGHYKIGFVIVAVFSLVVSCIFQEIENGK